MRTGKNQPEPLTYAARLLRRERQRRSRRRRRRVTGLAVLLAPLLVVAGTSLDDRGSSAAPSKARDITVTWGGDIAYDSRQPLPRDRFAGLSSIRQQLDRGDLTIVNLEGTLGTGGSTKCAGEASAACFGFQAPPAIAGKLGNAGVDATNLANNHSLDSGPEGLKATVEALRDADLGHAGAAGQIGYVQTDAGKVALVGLAAYAWTSDIRDLSEIRAKVRVAARQADHVVVMMHGGREGRDATSTPVGSETAFGEDRGNLRLAARTAVDSGADLVVGSGPHVVRGLELYRKRLIAYSAGNLAANGTLSLGGTYSISALVRAKLGENGRLLSGKVVPLVLTGSGRPEIDPEGEAIEIMNAAGRKDFGKDAVRLRPSGEMVVRP